MTDVPFAGVDGNANADRSRLSNRTDEVNNVRFWHKADITRLGFNVRFWNRRNNVSRGRRRGRSFDPIRDKFPLGGEKPLVTDASELDIRRAVRKCVPSRPMQVYCYEAVLLSEAEYAPSRAGLCLGLAVDVWHAFDFRNPWQASLSPDLPDRTTKQRALVQSAHAQGIGLRIHRIA